MSFIATNIPDKVKILPNEYSMEDVQTGYKTVKTLFIDFVKKYNTSKTASSIPLNPEEMEALKKLHIMWKNATLDKVEKGGNHFFDMNDYHDQLNIKFPKTSEDVVSASWNGYIQGHSDWMKAILFSSAIMFQLQL